MACCPRTLRSLLLHFSVLVLDSEVAFRKFFLEVLYSPVVANVVPLALAVFLFLHGHNALDCPGL